METYIYDCKVPLLGQELSPPSTCVFLPRLSRDCELTVFPATKCARLQHHYHAIDMTVAQSNACVLAGVVYATAARHQIGERRQLWQRALAATPAITMFIAAPYFIKPGEVSLMAQVQR